MPVLHTNPSGPDVLALIEELGLQVSEAYAVAEIRLLRIILDRVNKDLDVTRELERVTALSDLARQARDVLAGINVATLVDDVVKTAVSEGELSAVARLKLAPAIRSAPVAGFSAQQAQMVAQIGAQLQGGLTAMSPTITRSVQDVYQRVIGEAVQQRIIGNFTQEQTRRIAVDKLLSNGLTGFVDKAGRQWKMGTYAEMATRTVASRAYDEAHIARINASDINLVTIIVGTGADAVCVNWAGKVLSTNGQTGPVQARNPLTGEPETVIVAGSLDQARAAGWKHVNCFPSFVPVESTTGISGVDSRWYSGNVVRIRTASGRDVTVTPNHPILTTEGWVRAGKIVRGDHVIRRLTEVEGVLPGRPDHEGAGKTSIGQVYQAIVQSGSVFSASVPGSTEQFHGDGIPNSEVNVVLSDRLLRADGQPAAFEFTAEGCFLFGGAEQPSLAGHSTGNQFGFASGDTTNGIMGSFGQGSPVFGAGVGHAGEHTLGPVSDGDAAVGEKAVDYWAGDTLSAGELQDGLAGQVAADEVVSVSEDVFSGHVYNLQTGGGWYLADDLIVHNCRCTVVAYMPGLPLPATITTYDPAAEKARQTLRGLERRKRAALAQQEFAPDDIAKAQARRRVTAANKAIADHVREANIPRQRVRESLTFQNGKR